MALTVTTTPGKQFTLNEGVTRTALNLLGKPTFVVTGTVTNTDLTVGSVTAAATTPGPYWYKAIAALTVNTYSATWSPAPPFPYEQGLRLSFLANSDYLATGPLAVCLLAANGNAGVAIKKNGKADLTALDIRSGDIVDVVFDGLNFQMQSHNGTPETTANTAGILVGGTATDLRATGADTYVIAPVVGGDARFKTLGELAGHHLVVQFTSSNTTLSTLTVTPLASAPLQRFAGIDLRRGEILANGIYTVIYDGTRFLLAGNTPALTSHFGYTATAVQTLNAFALTYAIGDGPSALKHGMTVTFRVAISLDGLTVPTIQITHNGIVLGPTNCTRIGGAALLLNDLKANQMATFIYNTSGGPSWELLTPREIGMAKAWCAFAGTTVDGVITPLGFASSGVLSITRATAGIYRVLFTSPSPVTDGGYAIFITHVPTSSESFIRYTDVSQAVAPTVTGFTIEVTKTAAGAGEPTDPAFIYFYVLGV